MVLTAQWPTEREHRDGRLRTATCDRVPCARLGINRPPVNEGTA